jgi:diguanylate cyclase (GGDEF)-like protein/PAS domain S-box-containing protein
MTVTKPSIRLLLVEDDAVDRLACRRALAAHPDYSFELIEAETGRQGIQQVLDREPDLVLLDYHLPDLNGLEFLAELRRETGEMPVPVMMLTGADNVAVAVEAMRHGARDYVVKDSERNHLQLLPAVIERVLREQRLHIEKSAAEAKYRTLVEQIPAISYIAALDVPGKLLYISPQVRSLGFSPEEWLSDPDGLLKQVVAEDRAAVRAAFARSYETGEPLRCEYRLLTRGGETRWCLDEATVVRDERGAPLFLQGVLVDITEDKRVQEELEYHRRRLETLVAQRTAQLDKRNALLEAANANLSHQIEERERAERSLRASEERYRALVEQASDGIFVADLDGRYIEVNDAGCHMLGYSRDEILGKTIVDLLPPEDVDRLWQSKEQMLKGGAHVAEWTLRRKDGTYLPVEVSAKVLPDGRWQGIVRDITERRRIEAALTQSRNLLERVFESIHVLIAYMDREFNFLRVNRAYAAADGRDPDYFVGKNHFALFPDAENEAILRQVVETGEPYVAHARPFAYAEHPERGVTYWDWRVEPVKGLQGEIQGVVLSLLDVTEPTRAAQALRESEARYRNLFENMADGYALQEALLDANGKPYDFRYLEVNPAFEHILGLKREQVVGKTVLEVLPATEPHWLEMFGRVAVSGQHARLEHYGQSFDRYFEVVASCPERGLVAVFFRDVTERRRAEEALRQSESRFRLLLESAGEGIYGLDTEGRCMFVNDAALAMLGYAREELIGRDTHSLIHHSHADGTRYAVDECRIYDAFRIGEASRGRIELLWRKDGTSFPAEYSAQPIREDGGVTGAVLLFRDVTEAQALAHRLSYQATHDSLTGLINRQEFERRLERALGEAKREGGEHALAYLDLDQFKVVNDSCGHAAGDQLLHQLSARLQERLRARDSFARLGGDEFGVLLEHCPIEQALRIANDLRAAVGDFRFVWEGRVFTIGASIGVVALTAATPGAAVALSAADSACYAAKEKGRNRVHVYQSDDFELAERRAQMRWVSRLTHALDEDRFELLYQPIAPLASAGGKRPHYEILLRLVDEDGRRVEPGAFIPAAERYNLMPAIDRWVLRRAIADFAARFREASGETRPIYAVNLSAVSLSDPGLAAFIRDLLAEHAVPPAALCLEITETAAIANLTQAQHLIGDLKQLGCLFSLDDFGTGMHSFVHLKTLPVDYLKIDGNFIRNLAEDRIGHAMAEAINRVAHVMEIQTVAECAESPRVLALLREIGIDHVQGYAIMRPRPLAELGAADASRSASDAAV